ncbi:hypothetical protein D3C87_1972880 [compost metagenome]
MLGAKLLDRCEMADTRVGDKVVEPAPPVEHGLYRFFLRCQVPHIRFDGQCVAFADFVQSICGFIGILLRAARNRHADAVADECFGNTISYSP